jgi:transposase
VIGLVEKGSAARAAGRHFEIGEATAIRWVQRWKETGSALAKPITRRRTSPLEAYAQWLLGLVDREPDLTLEEIQRRLLEQQGHKAGIGSVWRFFDRHGISFKKKRARRRTGSLGRGRGARRLGAGTGQS